MSVLLLTVAAAASLAVQAEVDFNKVLLPPVPRLADTTTCVQSEAAAIAAATPVELPLQYFRRGYCTLAEAAITGDKSEYAAAAADFDRAVAAWPGRVKKLSKDQPAPPVPGVLRILSWIGRLHSGTVPEGVPQWQESGTAACSSYLMTDGICAQIMETGRQWMGWFALGSEDFDGAARYFSGAPENGWHDWAEGRQLFRQHQYSEAAAAGQRAITSWQEGASTLLRRLGPQPDLPTALADLGGAQMLAGDARAAIATLSASLKLRPANPQALFRRARAHDLAGEKDAALADYSLAARTAFAAEEGAGSGEAHLYRGIMLYRRGDYGRAEDEFASALNFQIAGPLRADAQAWRHLTAVARGSCAESGRLLDRTLPEVSAYFPKLEARRVETACR